VGVLHKHVVVVPDGAALMPLFPLIYALLFSVHSLIAGERVSSPYEVI